MANKLITCKTCGAEIAKNAKVCPSCGAKNKKGKKIIIVIVALALLVLFIAIASSGGSTKDLDYSNPVAKISADAILSAYKANSVTADETYKNQLIQVTGKISNISESTIYLKGDEDENWLNTVDCSIISGQDDVVKSLSKDMVLSIIGVCNSTGVAGDVKLSDCKIIADNIEIKTTAAQDDKAEDTVIKIDATTLLEEYNDNSVAADEKYKNKKLQVSGKISSVEDGYISIESSDDWAFSTIHAYYNSEQDVSKLSKGNIITILGTCKGEEIFSDIKISDCVIVTE